MKHKLVARMVRLTADANPDKSWMSTYLGVIGIEIPSLEDANPMLRAIAPPYSMMCGAIDEFIDLEYGESVLSQIETVQRRESDLEEAEGHAFICWITPNGVVFEFQYGENGPEKGGEVTLAQFKLAVQTYLQFLRDPERKPIEVPFPE